MNETVTIEKLVHGGQGLATMADGRKLFVWNALPGERLGVRIIKTKKSYAEGIAEDVIKPSPERILADEENYLATSPWQMMTYAAENTYKRQIVSELFEHEKVMLPAYGDTVHDARQWGYRSKMEYSFWGDDEGVHLALHQRGSHGKQIVRGSKLAMPAIDAAANAICVQLNDLNNGKGARAGDLKTIIVRCDQKGTAVAALFVKLDTFTELTLPSELKGLRVYHSDPRSPASVPTRLLYELGDCLLHDELLGTSFVYDVDSFFQVNVPVFQLALKTIKQYVREPAITDMYAGVGSIGLSVASRSVDLIELDPASVRMAIQNADDNLQAGGPSATVVEASTEKVLEYITRDKPVIFDPPRAGLHDKVVARVLEAKPPKIVYLSCNPATHARDLAKLQTVYGIEHFSLYNFFPRTPHIETMAVLRRNSGDKDE
jgi:23S rRNA (uracil1939-C5)-methyltransferase